MKANQTSYSGGSSEESDNAFQAQIRRKSVVCFEDTPDIGLFSNTQQKNMIKWLQECAAQGLIISYDYFVEEVFVQAKKKAKISHSAVERWVSAFQRRWSGMLRSGSAGPLLSAGGSDRPAVSAAAWYRAVSGTIANRYPAVPFADPDRLLYLGEMNVHLDADSAAVRRLRSSDDAEKAFKDNAAFVVAVSASGERAPLMLVTPSNGLVREDLEGEQDCLLQVTSDGTVTPDALRRYISESLEPYLLARKVARPVLLYLDGLHHHGSMELSNFCDDAGLVLVGLPPGGAARSPVRAALAAPLAANLARLAASVQRGRRPEADGRCSASAAGLLAGFRAATRRVTAESIAAAFTSSCLSPWSESVVSACESTEPAPELGETELPPPPPAPLSPAPLQRATPESDAGIPLPPDGIGIQQAVCILLDKTRQMQVVTTPPRDRRDNVAYLVCDKSNVERRHAMQRPLFGDDADEWRYLKNHNMTCIIPETGDESVFLCVHRNKDGLLCGKKQRQGEMGPLDPQPTEKDTVLSLRRHYSSWKSDASYTRRITWITGCQSGGVSPPPVTLYEFSGCCPDRVTTGSGGSGSGVSGSGGAGSGVSGGGVSGSGGLSSGGSGDSGSRGPGTAAASDRLASGGKRCWLEPVLVDSESAEIPKESLDLDQVALAPPPAVSTEDPRGFPIPSTGLPADQLIRLLLDTDRHHNVLDSPPSDKTKNTAYIVNNEVQRERTWRGLPCRYKDGPDKWGGMRVPRKPTYLLDETGARRVKKVRDRFLEMRQVDGKLTEVPLDPQPSGDFTVLRLIQMTSRQCGGSRLLRKITWIERCDPLPTRFPAIALYEYMDRGTDGWGKVPRAKSLRYVKRLPPPGAEEGSATEEMGSESESETAGRRKRPLNATEQSEGETAGVKRQRRLSIEDVMPAAFMKHRLSGKHKIEILLDKSKHHVVLDTLPVGRKENVGFLVSNKANQHLQESSDRAIHKTYRFHDDDEPWLFEHKGMRYFMKQQGWRGSHKWQNVTKNKDGLYCFLAWEDGQGRWEPCSEQPADSTLVVQLITYYGKSTLDKYYTRTVTWLRAVHPEGMPVPAVALYEYFRKDDGNGENTDGQSPGDHTCTVRSSAATGSPVITEILEQSSSPSVITETLDQSSSPSVITETVDQPSNPPVITKKPERSSNSPVITEKMERPTSRQVIKVILEKSSNAAVITKKLVQSLPCPDISKKGECPPAPPVIVLKGGVARPALVQKLKAASGLPIIVEKKPAPARPTLTVKRAVAQEGHLGKGTILEDINIDSPSGGEN